MQLMRVLQKGIKLQTINGAEPDGDTICGSMAAHFKVSDKNKKSELSFYEIGGDHGPSIERVALGVMLARLARNDALFDDVDGCILDQSAVQATGANAYLDGKGETPLPDVNAAHWAVEGVTIRRLAELVVSALTPELRDACVSKAKLAWAYDQAVASGAIGSSFILSPAATADLEQLRRTKAYKRIARNAATA